jgi:hypothetical protein
MAKSPKTPKPKTDGATFDAGLAVRRDMFGPGGAEKQIEAATEFTAPLQDLVTRYCFGTARISTARRGVF